MKSTRTEAARTAHVNLFVRLSSVLVAVGALFIGIVSQVWSTPREIGVAAAILCGIVSLPDLWRLVRGTSRFLQSVDFFSPAIAFPLAYILWFSIGSVDLLNAPSSVSFGLLDPIPAHMWFYYAVGLVSYLAGVWIVSRRSMNPMSRRNLPRFRSVWRGREFRFVIGILSLLMVASYIYITSDIGIPALDPLAGVIRLELGKHGPTLNILVSAAYTILVFLCGQLWIRPQSRRAQLIYVLGTIATVIALLSLGGRGFLFQPLLTVLVLRHYLKKKYNIVKLGFALGILFVLISYYGYKRDLSLLGIDSLPTFENAGFPSFILPYTYSYLYIRYSVATFRDVAAVIPSLVPYQHGWLTFQPFQTLLPGHHHSSDFFFKSILGNEFEGAGQPATLLGTFYGDFGILGIFLGMFGFGALSMSIYRWMLRDRTLCPVAIYTWLVHAALFSLFITVFPFPTHLWVPIMWIILDRFMRRSSFKALTTGTGSLSGANT